MNLDKVAIPQADEQQRLLANLVLKMNADRKPLPRFWYFPRGKKAVVVMAVDNHGSENVEHRFAAEDAASPAGCSVDDWECIRSTAYLYTERAPRRRHGEAVGEQGLRGRAARQHELRGLDPDDPARLLHEPDGGLLREVPLHRAAADEPDALHRVERLGDAAEGRARERHPLRHELLLLAARRG